MFSSRSARLWTTLIALGLLVPILGLFTQDPAALEQFHKRRLRPWPERGEFLADPVTYLTGARSWFRDRAYPIVAATHLANRFAYHVLGDAPAPRIGVGKRGHVFINGTKNDTPHDMLESVCVKAHHPKTVRGLEASLASWRKASRRLGVNVDVVSVPTANTLYADALPDSVPERYRSACANVMAANTPLLSVKTPSSIGFVYPLREMLAARDDPAFYPRGNWHPNGLSLRVVRDTYLARRGLPAPSGETRSPSETLGEILIGYGVNVRDPVYVLRNDAVSAQPAQTAAVAGAIASLFKGRQPPTHVFANQNPVADERVLMLSDSFGDLGAEAFAGAFRRLIHVTTNDLKAPASKLIAGVRQLEPIDRILILIEEGNAPRVRRMLN